MIRTRVWLPHGHAQCYIYQVKKDLALYGVEEAQDPEFDQDLRRYYLNTDHGAQTFRIAFLEAQLEQHINPKFDDEEQAYYDFAMHELATDELEIDNFCKVALGDDPGAFVQMWKWVPRSRVFPADEEE